MLFEISAESSRADICLLSNILKLDRLCEIPDYILLDYIEPEKVI